MEQSIKDYKVFSTTLELVLGIVVLFLAWFKPEYTSLLLWVAVVVTMIYGNVSRGEFLKAILAGFEQEKETLAKNNRQELDSYVFKYKASQEEFAQKEADFKAANEASAQIAERLSADVSSKTAVIASLKAQIEKLNKELLATQVGLAASKSIVKAVSDIELDKKITAQEKKVKAQEKKVKEVEQKVALSQVPKGKTTTPKRGKR